MIGAPSNTAGFLSGRSPGVLRLIAIGGLLLGFALGALILRLSTAQGAPNVTNHDLAVIVADLYAKEKSVFNARRRLEVTGAPPVELVENTIEEFARTDPGAATAGPLRELALALRQGEVEAGANPPIANIGVILVMLLSVVIGVLIAYFMQRRRDTRGVVQVARRGPATEEEGSGSAWFSMPRGLSSRPITSALTQVGNLLRPRTSTSHSRVGDDGSADGRPEQGAPREHRHAPRTHRVDGVESSARALTHSVTVQRFEADYEIGDETYDQAFAIRDSEGQPIAACGISATERVQRDAHYYGFTLWVQDYRDRGDMEAIGLVTPSAHRVRSAAIAEWCRTVPMRETLVAEEGTVVHLHVPSARVRATVLDVQHRESGTASPGYVTQLSIRFECATSVSR